MPELGNKPPKSQGHKCLIDPLECNTCNTDKVSTRSNGSGTILGKRTCRLVGALTNEKAFRNQPTAIFHRRFCLSISADDGPCAWNYFAARASNWHVEERGLPQAIRSDNGVPFASPNGLFNLSKLAVWWLRLGITIERIQPGHPQQNGRHERMHRTLKTEATRPAGSNFLQQQAKFDAFVHEFNNERPHQALDMKCPADLYKPSTRPYRGIGELSYPFHDRTALVTYCGRICIFKKKINLSTSLAGQAVGIKEVDDGIWLVSFMDYDLGYIDLEEKTLQPLHNPFGPKV